MSDGKALADPIEADLAHYKEAYERVHRTLLPIARSYKTFDSSLVPRRVGETATQYEERLIDIEIRHLASYTPRLFDAEESRLDELIKRKEGFAALREGTAGLERVDASLKLELDWLRKELVDYYGSDMPVRRMLIDRLISAWSMALSYERMFKIMKYKVEDSGGVNIIYDSEHTRFIAEARKGIETANNQILRLTQALENLRRPQAKFKITNAYIAQNQQINQGVSPKDLEKSSLSPAYVQRDP